MELVPRFGDAVPIRLTRGSRLVLGRNVQTGLKESDLSRNLAVLEEQKSKFEDKWMLKVSKSHCVIISNSKDVRDEEAVTLLKDEERSVRQDDVITIMSAKGEKRWSYLVNMNNKRAERKGKKIDDSNTTDKENKSNHNKINKDLQESCVQVREGRLLPSWMTNSNDDSAKEQTELISSNISEMKTTCTTTSINDVEVKALHTISSDEEDDEFTSTLPDDTNSKNHSGTPNDPHSNEEVDTPDENRQASSDGARRVPCKYGGKCYRKNPQHRVDFAHPDDCDFVDGRNECKFGLECSSKNKRHISKFKHTSQGMKKERRRRRSRQDDDEALEYHGDNSNDSSINFSSEGCTGSDFSDTSDEWSPKKARMNEQESSDDDLEDDDDDDEDNEESD